MSFNLSSLVHTLMFQVKQLQKEVALLKQSSNTTTYYDLVDLNQEEYQLFVFNDNNGNFIKVVLDNNNILNVYFQQPYTIITDNNQIKLFSNNILFYNSLNGNLLNVKDKNNNTIQIDFFNMFVLGSL